MTVRMWIAGAAALLLAVGARAQGDKPYGVLLLAYDVGGAWKTELGAIRSSLRGRTVESVESTTDGVTIQRTLNRLRSQHVGKIVAVPLEVVSESPIMDQLRYLFAVRAETTEDRPDRPGTILPPIHSKAKHMLVLPSNTRPQRLKSDAALVLTETIDKSPFLAEILAERAQAQSRRPENEAVVLVGLAPRSDKALSAWKVAAAAVAEAVRVKGGFRAADVMWVRDGVRTGQQDKDLSENKTTLRRLATQGRVVAVPLALDGRRVGRLLQRQGLGGYRWNGKGLIGDKRLIDWIRTASEAASQLPDVRQYRERGLP